MAGECSISSSDTEARTAGAAAAVGCELVARFSTADHSAGAEALLRYLCQAAAETDLCVADGESARYGYAAVAFSSENGTLVVHDPGRAVVDEAVVVFEIQRLTCQEQAREFLPPPADALGLVSPGVREGEPFEMLRHPALENASGWWFLDHRYDGDTSKAEGHHLAHIAQWRPEILPYLALPPGSVVRVGHEGDVVSFDDSLLVGHEPTSG